MKLEEWVGRNKYASTVLPQSLGEQAFCSESTQKGILETESCLSLIGRR